MSSFVYRARISYIDYEGRSDGDSIKKIINQMKPRQLVIVHGPPEASLDLAESCKAFSKDIKVYTPKLQETVDATSETHIYQVRHSLSHTEKINERMSALYHFDVFCSSRNP